MADEYVVSVVLEGNSTSLESASNRGADSQKRLKKSTQEANIEFLAQVARYQAMTAALNQTIGGLNKLAGGLEEIGFEKTAEHTRRFTKMLELVAGPAEIYLAYLTLTIALGQKDIATKGAQTAATGTLSAATAKLNAVMLANPLIALGVAIVILVIAFVALERRFGVVTKAVDALNEGLFILDETFNKIMNIARGVASTFDRVNDSLSGKGLVRLMRGGRI